MSSILISFPSPLGYKERKRSTYCLYDTIVFDAADHNILGPEGTKNIPFFEPCYQNSNRTADEIASSIMFAHSHNNETTKLGDTGQRNSPASKVFSCGDKNEHGPQMPDCYTCARVLHHQIPSILKAIDELFEKTAATAATNTPFSSSSSLPNYNNHHHHHHQSRFQGLQYAPALERALLEGHSEQSSIIAFGVEVGDLSLSPKI